MVRLMIVGGGRMGEALASGLLDADWCTPDELLIIEPNPTRAEELRRAHPGVRVGSAIFGSRPEL